MTERTAVHATFVIERTYDAAPSQVFAAFADPQKKALWFKGPPGWVMEGRVMDFRVGGREGHRIGPKGGTVHAFDCIYQDIVPNERIIFSYDMHLGDKRISVSLASIELKPEGKGTHLTFTEQGVFLDGYDGAANREQGTNGLLDALGAELKRSALS